MRDLNGKTAYHVLLLAPPATVRVFAALPDPKHLTQDMVWGRISDLLGTRSWSYLARRASIPQSTMSRWSRRDGFPDAVDIVRIADALEVPVTMLLHVPDEAYDPPVDPATAEEIRARAQQIIVLLDAERRRRRAPSQAPRKRRRPSEVKGPGEAGVDAAGS